MKTPPSNADCDNIGTENKCGAYEGDEGELCLWIKRDQSRCSDYQECTFYDEDTCNSGGDDSEVCYWDDDCRKGKRPTTVTTLTATTRISKCVGVGKTLPYFATTVGRLVGRRFVSVAFFTHFLLL